MPERAWPADVADLTDDALAALLLESRADGVTRPALSSLVELDLDRAYRVQAAGATRRVAAGERAVGWKLGYTSAAMREQMRIDAPNLGPLFDSMRVGSGDDIGNRFLQPRVEPEIAIVVGTDVDHPANVRNAVAAAHACLEVVDSVYTAYRFTLCDNTADGSSAAGFVLGDPLPGELLHSLADVDVEFDNLGDPLVVSSGAAASGDPLAGVSWLVTELARTGRRLRAGDLVLTGGLTASVALDPGGAVRATFAGSAHVSVCRTASAAARASDR